MKRESVGWGIILILVGLGFLANQLFPGLFAGFAWVGSLAAAAMFFVAGTNRAMFRFTLMNHLCTDLEQVQERMRGLFTLANQRLEVGKVRRADTL